MGVRHPAHGVSPDLATASARRRSNVLGYCSTGGTIRGRHPVAGWMLPQFPAFYTPGAADVQNDLPRPRVAPQQPRPPKDNTPKDFTFNTAPPTRQKPVAKTFHWDESRPLTEGDSEIFIGGAAKAGIQGVFARKKIADEQGDKDRKDAD